MKFLPFLFLTGLIASCAGPREALVVRQFQLRDQEADSREEPSIRMEKLRHLHGAVTMEERKKKLGQYYTILWSDPKPTNQGKVELLFQYQQGASGSLIKKMTREFPASDTQGQADFAVIGDDYFIGGKVLTWKATLLRGNREIATQKSYLWQ